MILTECNETLLLLAFPRLQLESQLISGPAVLETIGRLVLNAAARPDFSLLDQHKYDEDEDNPIEDMTRLRYLRTPESY